ncbi:hypothetical protein, partial [Bathymodiolus thermophilus thioautotrophic gill symbiont]
LGGGKFANGALSAAFVHLFRESIRPAQRLKVRFSGGSDEVDTMFDSGEEAYNEFSGGKLAKVKDLLLRYAQTPRGREVMAQSGTLKIQPGNGSASFNGVNINFSGRGGLPALGHEIGHTIFGGGYVDYRGQGCPSCPVGNVRYNENPFRMIRRETYTETNRNSDYYGHMFWVY